MATVGRSVGYSLVLTLALAALAFLVDRSADPIIDEFEKVIVPCQHGGEWVSAKETCRCLGPWTGKYCGECACENGGVCDTNNIQVATPGTLWGCRCPDRLVGPLCEQCNANLTDSGQCAGPCKDGYTGPDCNRFCSETPTFEDVVLDAGGEYDRELEMLNYGGELHVCSGHGSCDGVTGYCECEPFYFSSEDGRSSCARTCPFVNDKLCAGHGRCGENAGVVSCACEFGYHLGPACDVVCPGMDVDYIQEPCSGRGTCFLESPTTAACECGELFIGEACQYRCPTGAVIESSEACSGHGQCREDDSKGFTKAVCDCESPFEGPGCGCTRSLTCTGHGNCRGDGTCECDVDPLFGKPVFRGERCEKCIPGHYGSDCRLQCTSHKPTETDFEFEEGRNIHCHGRGTCAVANFGLADESVVCGACSGNFATESHCEECKDNFYPKFSVMDPDELASCTTFATRTTCNGAGEPKDTFGRKIKPPEDAEDPCECDAPHADASAFCSKCELSYYPSNLKEDPQGACSRRCVDKELIEGGEPVSVAHIETLECVNDGVCADDGLSCICADGYSGIDCGIACGAPDEHGRQCSGHGQCVANTLQQFLEFEINVRGFTASRCECSPQDDLTEAERLKIFTGELLDQTGEATKGRSKRDWYGDTCGFGCLAAPWKDGTECNNERCEVIPIADDAGNPILQCTQDSQCGAYENGILKFYEGGAEKTVLTSDESRLRGAVSLSRRWSKRTGPFCHVTNTPFSVWEPNMKCAQRINKDGEDPTKEAECHKYTTRYDCLHKGEGACHYIDVCTEALDEFDTWSYCYELMRTQEPPALRTKECAESCNATLLKPVEWGKKCAHYRDRVPDSLCAANKMQNLDELCDLAEAAGVTSTQLVSDCDPALPPAGVAFTASLDAADASAFCWEASDQVGAMRYPFNFTALLDTPEARHLQAAFHSLFTELGSRDACVADSEVNPESCANVPEPDGAQANVLYLCSYDGVQVLESTDKSGLGVSCEPLPTVQDVSPFEMVCPETVEGLSEISLEDAVSLSARRGCALRAKSALHASSVAVDNAAAMEVCKRVLDAESPSACERACGPEDQCSDLGTTHDGKRLLQCRRPDASDVGIDPDTGKCDNCLIGDCSITGREGGAEYRCVVPVTEIAESATPPRFEPCGDTLLLHLDELGGGTATVGSVQGIRAVTLHETNETVTIYEDADPLDALSSGTLDGAALAGALAGALSALDNAAEGTAETVARPPPARVEFDVRLGSDGRGRVAVLGKNGTLVSLLLHYYGGFGYDVNVPLEEDFACDAGDEDNCKFVVAPGTTYRVAMTLDWETELVSVKFADQSEVVRNITMEADDFVGVAASGTARVSQLWVFSSASATCASLHRKLGRSLTMQASHKPVEEQPPLSMSFCAGVEKAVAEHVKDCAHEREAVFGVPWHDYCAYADHLEQLTDSGDCGDWQGDQALTVACEPVLSKFATPDCAKNAVTFDWETDYCVLLRNDTKPDELVAANCSAECIDKVAEDDFAQLCDDRDKYWDASDETVKPDFLPGDCNDNGKWKEVDWVEYCTEKAENSAVGYCSAAVCDCRGQGGWMTGDACELDCPMADDYSPCAEDSLGGYCTYRRRDAAAADAFYEDPDNNLIKNHPVMQIQGKCACSHPDALAEEGCKVECDSPDGGPACNTRTYMSNGTEWQLSACDAGGSGVCRCMSPLARRVNTTVSNWRGQSMNVLTVEFGDYEGTNTTAFPSMSAFRLYAQQGAKELMVRYFGAAEAVWETMKLKFESSPADFDCSGRECDFHDVVIAQSLYSSSSFFGGSCSRRCPGVDTGEDMVEMTSGCDIAESTLSGKDRVSEEGCQSECLDDFRCEYSKWEAATSNCFMFSTCVLQPDVVVPEGTQWRQRVLQRSPNLTPCSGRGQCGLTGQCQCDPAKFLSLTDPITGEKNLIPSNQRGGLSSTPITTLDLTGYRGDKCDKVCPGYNETRKSMADVCSGHGICTRAGACQCDVNYVGVNCELRCPVKDLTVEDDQTVCAGHGTCSEARIFAGYDATEEDSKRYYMVTEAYRKWHNECLDNIPIDYFILPFENFPGSVASGEIKGGVDCESVPQEQDVLSLPYIQRPEIKLQGLADYVFLDDEKALNEESLKNVVEGVSAFDRQGIFRRRYWYNESDGTIEEQTVFVENYARVSALYNDTTSDYDRYFGYKCGILLQPSLQPSVAVETVADCAETCRSVDTCACFHYREFYHRRFRGECVLGTAGPVVPYPVEKVAYVHTTNGFLRKLDPTSSSWATATPTPFDAFTESYVQLHSSDSFPASCRATTSLLGTNVASLDACAALCAGQSASGGPCTYFSYDPLSRRCAQVRTTSAECVEGMTPDPAGFYAVSLNNTGAIAPTAYTRSGSARIFPYTVTNRGTLSGTYVGRARPNYETAIASCDCLSNAAWGFWDGHRCHTCQKFYGSKTCSRRCPGVTAAEEPCFGYGKCLWGSKDGEGEEFYQSRCLCGDPAAPYMDDLATVGTWDVEEFELYVKAQFNGLPPSESFEDPRNYNFASSSCSGCKEGFGGLNCASTCSYCLFGGTCSFTPSTISISVPCNCIGQNYDPYNSCCPSGFTMLESLVHNDVGLLTTSLRRKRLTMEPGATPAVGTFFDSVVFPNLEESLFPSRRWCVPGPGMFETGWMQTGAAAESRACGGDGVLRDRGMRKLVVGATPSKYFPQFCSDLGADDTNSDYWLPVEKELWYTYPNKVFLSSIGDATSSITYLLDGVTVGGYHATEDEFGLACRGMCTLDSCTGVVVRKNNSDFGCFVSTKVFVSEPHPVVYDNNPHAVFTAYRKQRQPEFCKHVDDSSNVCVLGSVSYGDVPLCAEKNLGDAAAFNTGLTTENLGNQCEVKSTAGKWEASTGAACDAAAPEDVRLYEETDVLQRLVPDANALLFGAYGNSQFQASAGEMVATVGVMRPENPCATLPGDYFWNKDNRTQCISASTKQTCSIKDWRHCTNFDVTGQALTYAHSIMETSGVYPHKISVLGQDHELMIVDPNYQYRMKKFDSDSLQTALDAHNADATASENAKEAEIEVVKTRIEYKRDESSAACRILAMNYYYQPRVFACENSTQVDTLYGGEYGYLYNFYTAWINKCYQEKSTYFQFISGCVNIYDTGAGRGYVDPLTWPKYQVPNCYDPSVWGSRGTQYFNDPACQSMGLQQLLVVAETIRNSEKDKFDYFWHTPMYDALRSSSDNIFNGQFIWPSRMTGYIFLDTRAMFLCMIETPACHGDNGFELVSEPQASNFQFERCYTKHEPWAGWFKTSDDSTTYYEQCPIGCSLVAPNSVNGPCYTCQKDNGDPCMVTYAYSVQATDGCRNNHCTAQKLVDIAEEVLNAPHDGLDTTFVRNGRTFKTVQNYYPRFAELHTIVSNELSTKESELTTLELQLGELVKDHEEERDRLEGEIARGNTDAKTNSCSNDVPCDICEGHCAGDDECRAGLLCRSPGDAADWVLQYCGGSKESGIHYCLPNKDDDQSDWVATNSKLYVAGAKLEAGATNTWLVEMGVDQSVPNTKPFVKGEEDNKGTFEECMYDCEDDGDCLPGLKCMQRSNHEVVPGCYGETPSEHDDVCYNPHMPLTVLSVHAKTKHNAYAGQTLVATRASVDILSPDYIPDSTELKGNFFAPGAAGKLHPHGHAPWFVEKEISGINDGDLTDLDTCTNECDANQCAHGLTCFQRQNGEKIPGCKGGVGIAQDWDFCYDPDFKSAAPPRAMLTETAEECANICDTTFGCTAAHWKKRQCYLFHFDPSMGCSLFNDISDTLTTSVTKDNNDNAAKNLNVCQGDCDTESNQCKTGHKCLETSSGERVPGCKGTSHGTYDICYDPEQIVSGFVKYADACQLCKSRGMRPYIDAAFTDSGFASTLSFCMQGDYVDDKPHHCALLPRAPDAKKPNVFKWEEHTHAAPWHQLRCPPTRAGVESNMHTHTVMVGKTFAETPYMVLRAHPEVTTFSQCENACAEDTLCEAWQFEENHAMRKAQIAQEAAPASRRLSGDNYITGNGEEWTLIGGYVYWRGEGSTELPEKIAGGPLRCLWFESEVFHVIHARNKNVYTRVEANGFAWTKLASHDWKGTLSGCPNTGSTYEAPVDDEEVVIVSAGITYEFGLFDCQSSDLAWMLGKYDANLHSTGYSGDKVAVKLNFDQCKALCTSRPSCTGFRMHTKSNLPGDDMSLGCEIFKGTCAPRTVDPSAEDYNPCPPTNPQLHEYATTNDYWCYTSYDASPCRMINSGYPPPTGSGWGGNQADCPLWHTWKKSLVGTHVCSLYDGTPVPLSTASVSVDTFSATSRVGFIERDFSGKIAFFDDGEHPACDCYEGSTAYNCRCSDESLEPYQGNATDATYGCAGHGRCASLEYKCICNDGYGWLWGDRDASTDNVGYTCRKCPEGTFKDKTVSTCTRCPLGKYQNEVGTPQCKECDSGTSSVVAGSKRDTDCILLPRVPCGAGTYVVGKGDCERCPAGFFTNTLEAAQCKECEAGFTSGEKAFSCDACAQGKYASSNVCTNCPAGYSTNEQTGQSDCNICDETLKEISSAGATDCSVCTKPFYKWPNTCEVCSNGKIDVGGSCDFCHDVTFCLRGGVYGVLADGDACDGVEVEGDESFFSSTGAARCERCGGGRYYSVGGTGEALGKITTCHECPVGYFSESDSITSSCADCPAGFYQDQLSSDACAACNTGRYQDGQKASECKECAAGHFQADQGAVACEDCASGLYQDQTGLPACKTCDDGYFTKAAAAASAADCVEIDFCLTGNYRRATGTDGCSGGACCKFCPAGKTTPGKGTYTEDKCETCPAGWSSSGERSAALNIRVSECLECAAGFAASEAYNNEGGHTNADFGSNPFQLCRVCSGAQYSTEAGQTACEACPEGYYGKQADVNAEGCEACAEGKISPYPAPLAGADSCVDPVCAAGQFSATLDPLDCQNCPAGYSQDHRRADECVQCAENKISKEGATQCEDAVCDAGQFSATLDPDNCQDCPVGYYQTYERSDDCLLCPEGFYQGDTKSTDCPGCPVGYYEANTNSAECTACPEGFYESNTNSKACTVCPAGWEATAEGATACVETTTAGSEASEDEAMSPASSSP